MVHSTAPPRKMDSIHSIIRLSLNMPAALDARSGVASGGRVAWANIMAPARGITVQSRARYCHRSLPNTVRNTVLITTTPTTPQAYMECSWLISLSGFFEGMAATTGLVSTSDSPAADEKIIVPSKINAYAAPGRSIVGIEYTTSPISVIRGVMRTTLVILKRCEKNEKTRSMDN